MTNLLKTAGVCAAAIVVLAAAPGAGQDPRTVLTDWPAAATPDVIGKRVAENFLGRGHMFIGPERVIHYAETCTWYGGLTFASLTKDRAMTQRLVERFEPLFSTDARLIPQPRNVDYAVFGAVPLELFIQTKDARYLPIGRELADRQFGPPPADLEPDQAYVKDRVAAGLSWHTRFWIDDMYMITILQTQAFRATGDRTYLDRAAIEAVAYLDKLQQPNGLFHHSTDVPFFWGRGDGWFAAGMAELLTSLPKNHPQRARILASYQKMMATLLKYQDADGMWHQLIDDPTSWPETSSTGMFTFAFITGVKQGWLDAAVYGPAARKAWLKLVTYLDDDGAIREVCAGTGARDDHQYYLDRPRIVGDFHGQAPLLWCASALLRK
jgi:unsaturated rhamnogalacturonyl hydrolase